MLAVEVADWTTVGAGVSNSEDHERRDIKRRKDFFVKGEDEIMNFLREKIKRSFIVKVNKEKEKKVTWVIGEDNWTSDGDGGLATANSKRMKKFLRVSDDGSLKKEKVVVQVYLGYKNKA
ncbi:hypothetical protein GOBAR_AA22841 [Gossypium barbadense]|uniref:Uncharacterized protein n=1 Tax=Gossypium barbadense TaxID=3634 RepID=A0A2P5X3C2_GOSBA|nr:hypothetical protein GOBAR_AA22841 [Gossypium barbadense]